MIRPMLAIVMLLACSLLGFSAAARLGIRSKALSGWMLALSELEREIKYTSTVLSQALMQAGARCEAGGAVFADVGQMLEDNRRMDVYEAFQNVSKALLEKKNNTDMLKEEDFACLRPLFASLGKSETDAQCALIEDVRERLSARRTEVESVTRTKGRLYRTMGILLGAMGAIIMM